MLKDAMGGYRGTGTEIIERKPNNKRFLCSAYKSRALVKEKIGDSEGAAEDINSSGLTVGSQLSALS